MTITNKAIVEKANEYRNAYHLPPILMLLKKGQHASALELYDATKMYYRGEQARLNLIYQAALLNNSKFIKHVLKDWPGYEDYIAKHPKAKHLLEHALYRFWDSTNPNRTSLSEALKINFKDRHYEFFVFGFSMTFLLLASLSWMAATDAVTTAAVTLSFAGVAAGIFALGLGLLYYNRHARNGAENYYGKRGVPKYNFEQNSKQKEPLQAIQKLTNAWAIDKTTWQSKDMNGVEPPAYSAVEQRSLQEKLLAFDSAHQCTALEQLLVLDTKEIGEEDAAINPETLAIDLYRATQDQYEHQDAKLNLLYHAIRGKRLEFVNVLLANWPEYDQLVQTDKSAAGLIQKALGRIKASEKISEDYLSYERLGVKKVRTPNSDAYMLASIYPIGFALLGIMIHSSNFLLKGLGSTIVVDPVAIPTANVFLGLALASGLITLGVYSVHAFMTRHTRNAESKFYHGDTPTVIDNPSDALTDDLLGINLELPSQADKVLGDVREQKSPPAYETVINEGCYDDQPTMVDKQTQTSVFSNVHKLG